MKMSDIETSNGRLAANAGLEKTSSLALRFLSLPLDESQVTVEMLLVPIRYIKFSL